MCRENEDLKGGNKMKKVLVTIMTLALIAASLCIMPANAENNLNNKITGIRINAPKSKAKIRINKKKATMYVGKKLKLKIKGIKAKKVKWSSSNKKVATVKKGIVKAKKKGRVIITAKVKGKKYKCKISVKKKKNTSYITLPALKGTQIGQSMLDSLYDGKNIIVSPLSLKYALAMAANGADTTARKGIERYLDTSVKELNNDLKRQMDVAKKDSMLHIANSFWYRDSLTIEPQYEKMLKNCYYADINKEKFNAELVPKINQWVCDNTDGMIKKIIEEIGRDEYAYLINALLFKGKWTEPFKHELTSPEVFTKADNKKVRVDMMEDTVWDYYENKYATGFEKTYGKNEEYSFVAVLPKKKGDFKLSQLNLNDFLKRKTNKYKVYIYLPKFEYSWKDSLSEPLQKTDVKYIFDAQINPLKNMFCKTNASIYVSDILQSCKIIMDEDGTKAAAVTITTVKATSALGGKTKVKTVNLNRPFAYVIKNNKTNEIMFMGKVLDPTQK